MGRLLLRVLVVLAATVSQTQVQAYDFYRDVNQETEADYKAGRYGEAIEKLKIVLVGRSDNPYHSDCNRRLAMCYEQTRQWDRAIDEWTDLALADPSEPTRIGYLNEAASCYIMSARAFSASKLLRMAIGDAEAEVHSSASVLPGDDPVATVVTSQTPATPPPVTRDRPDSRKVRYEIYRVLPGDTVASIAARFGVEETRIIEVNQLDASAPLEPGMSLAIILPDRSHVKSEPNQSATASEKAAPQITTFVPQYAAVQKACTITSACPPERGEVLWEADAGTRVIVNARQGDYYGTVWLGGSTGWLPKDSVKLTNEFFTFDDEPVTLRDYIALAYVTEAVAQNHMSNEAGAAIAIQESASRYNGGAERLQRYMLEKARGAVADGHYDRVALYYEAAALVPGTVPIARIRKELRKVRDDLAKEMKRQNPSHALPKSKRSPRAR